MGNNKYFDELISSYLSNNLDPEEEEFVLEWIHSSSENKQYYEEIKTIWNLLAVNKAVRSINVECEWEQFKQVVSTKEEKLFSAELPEKVEMARKVKPNINAKIYKGFISTAVAASILLAIVLVWRVAYNSVKIEKTIAVTNNGKAQPRALIQYHLNTTDKPKLLVLQDGSEVKLYSKSLISYQEPFPDDKRAITLVGKADFKVAKDKTKPFTVLSGDIATTALGTYFSVTAFGSGRNIIVRLYEGKVVVKSSHSAKRKLSKDFYLVPGQELVYNNKELTAKIRTFRTEGSPVVKNINKKEIYPVDSLSVTNLGSGSWYMFNHQSLDEVFDQLEAMFDADITYSKKEIGKIYFIGTFNKSDSLEHVLDQIAAVSNLKIIKKNNKYIIKKSSVKFKD